MSVSLPLFEDSMIAFCLLTCSEVTCVIMQRNGAGFYAGSSVYWDNQRDGKFALKFESVHNSCNSPPCLGSANYRFENKSMFAIVNVFGLSV